jgi:hypothetical protein
MTHFSRQLALRLIWLSIWLLLTLGWTIYWFTHTPYEVGGKNNFTPAGKLTQLVTMGQVLQEALAFEDVSPVDAKFVLDCDQRDRSILQIRMMQNLRIDHVQVKKILNRIESNAQTPRACTVWVANIGILADALSIQNTLRPPKPLAKTLGEALTERVSWTTRAPCLYFNRGKSLGLAYGTPLKCTRGSDQLVSHDYQIATGIRNAVHWSKGLMANGEAPSLRKIAPEDMVLTLDNTTQNVLDIWGKCLTHQTCSRSIAIPALKHVSIVVLDSDSGDILATLCWSGPCEKHKELGNLGALLIETPPASTIKMLHALALADSGNVDPLMLQRQIKTSGQIGAAKHNEWWEKQAICDGKSGDCLHIARVKALAQKFALGTDCELNDLQCGRQTLVEHAESPAFSGFVGKIKISNSFSKSNEMMDWHSYDQIRQHKQIAPKSKIYVNTLLAVQSVIGAGDSRSSALGIANMASQIARLSNGQGAIKPALIRPVNNASSGVLPSPSERRAAATVLGGMRKVLEPTETGWVGAGTVSAAFERNFKGPCVGDCGVWAKTGTVGVADKGFAGVTLVATVINVPQLHRWRYKVEAAPQGRKLALGVVVYPQSSSGSVNIASEIAMQLAADLSTQGKPNERDNRR